MDLFSSAEFNKAFGRLSVDEEPKDYSEEIAVVLQESHERREARDQGGLNENYRFRD